MGNEWTIAAAQRNVWFTGALLVVFAFIGRRVETS
jgi:hypothetical protein